ncbi:MAG: ATP-dependent DNA ligase [Desulfobacterales bacterium]
MRAFADLFRAMDETNRTNAKVTAMAAYFQSVPAEDAIWAVRFLMGRKPRQVVPTRKLMEWAAQAAQIPEWLFRNSYEVVGDLAETIALLLPAPGRDSRRPLHVWVEDHLLPLREKELEIRRAEILAAWQQMDEPQRLVWNKLITGGFRVGVSRRLVVRALSAASGIESAVIFHRLMGDWPATAATYRRILSSDTQDADISRPYPFFLAHPLEGEVAQLGSPGDWQAEWKWDGIRGQVIRRGGQTFIWSRGEELVTPKYPEIAAGADQLPDGTVLDGEILPWKAGAPLAFGELQRRIGRKRIGPKLLQTVPVVFLAYDLLEHSGTDFRGQPLAMRRTALARLLTPLAGGPLGLSPEVDGPTWEALADLRNQARKRGVEGLVMKRRNAAYGVGRKRGIWWKWKVNPRTVDGVLMYAQRGHGRRAGLFSDYTFGVWQGEILVPFAKAYSGLSNAEIREVDRFITRNTRERFGPVRSVAPQLVFEIAFEGIWPSTRHKSGVAVRFPRILRWRRDKPASQADTLESLQQMLTVKSDA